MRHGKSDRGDDDVARWLRRRFGGEREPSLSDLAELRGTAYMNAAIEETGAVLMGEKAVTVVGGATVVQELLRGSHVDELHVDVMPVLLGSSLRLLENLDSERLRLQKLGVQEVGARTSLRFRVAGNA